MIGKYNLGVENISFDKEHIIVCILLANGGEINLARYLLNSKIKTLFNDNSEAMYEYIKMIYSKSYDNMSLEKIVGKYTTEFIKEHRSVGRLEVYKPQLGTPNEEYAQKMMDKLVTRYKKYVMFTGEDSYLLDFILSPLFDDIAIKTLRSFLSKERVNDINIGDDEINFLRNLVKGAAKYDLAKNYDIASNGIESYISNALTTTFFRNRKRDILNFCTSKSIYDGEDLGGTKGDDEIRSYIDLYMTKDVEASHNFPDFKKHVRNIYNASMCACVCNNNICGYDLFTYIKDKKYEGVYDELKKSLSRELPLFILKTFTGDSFNITRYSSATNDGYINTKIAHRVQVFDKLFGIMQNDISYAKLENVLADLRSVDIDVVKSENGKTYFKNRENVHSLDDIERFKILLVGMSSLVTLLNYIDEENIDIFKIPSKIFRDERYINKFDSLENYMETFEVVDKLVQEADGATPEFEDLLTNDELMDMITNRKLNVRIFTKAKLINVKEWIENNQVEKSEEETLLGFKTGVVNIRNQSYNDCVSNTYQILVGLCSLLIMQVNKIAIDDFKVYTDETVSNLSNLFVKYGVLEKFNGLLLPVDRVQGSERDRLHDLAINLVNAGIQDESNEIFALIKVNFVSNDILTEDVMKRLLNVQEEMIKMYTENGIIEGANYVSTFNSFLNSYYQQYSEFGKVQNLFANLLRTAFISYVFAKNVYMISSKLLTEHSLKTWSERISSLANKLDILESSAVVGSVQDIIILKGRTGYLYCESSDGILSLQEDIINIYKNVHRKYKGCLDYLHSLYNYDIAELEEAGFKERNTKKEEIVLVHNKSRAILSAKDKINNRVEFSKFIRSHNLYKTDNEGFFLMEGGDYYTTKTDDGYNQYYHSSGYKVTVGKMISVDAFINSL